MYYEVNISHIFLNSFGRYDSCLSFVMPFHELKTTMLCQNDDLLKYAVNCKIFRKIITHVKYFAKYSKSLLQNEVRLITKYGRFFITERCNLSITKRTVLLQNVAGITKCAHYYKMRCKTLFNMR